MADINYADLFSKVELCKNAIIIGHSHPDGDCVGSAVALASLVEALGGKAEVIFPEPAPKRLAFLLGNRKELECLPSDLSGYDIIGIDVASPSQLASLREAVEDRLCLRIDHHDIASLGAKNVYVDETASAAAMIVFDLWEYAVSCGKVQRISDEAVNAIFASTSSDTGCFKYANVTPKTHITAAKLIELGARSAEINRLLFDTKDVTQLKAEGIAINKIELFADGLISGIAVDLSDYGDTLGIKDFETAIDIARSVRGARCAVCAKASPTAGTFRVSLRANDDTDVSKIAAKFDGGGHVRAAGCTVYASSAKEALCAVVEEIKKVL